MLPRARNISVDECTTDCLPHTLYATRETRDASRLCSLLELLRCARRATLRVDASDPILKRADEWVTRVERLILYRKVR